MLYFFLKFRNYNRYFGNDESTCCTSITFGPSNGYLHGVILDLAIIECVDEYLSVDEYSDFISGNEYGVSYKLSANKMIHFKYFTRSGGFWKRFEQIRKRTLQNATPL